MTLALDIGWGTTLAIKGYAERSYPTIACRAVRSAAS